MNGPLSEKVIYMAFAVSHLATSFSKKGGQFRHQDDWIISGTDIARLYADPPLAHLPAMPVAVRAIRNCGCSKAEH